MIDDPAETNNLADSLPELLQQMKTDYLDWYKEVVGSGITPAVIPVGYSEAPLVQLPGHEAILTGSMRYKQNPNGWAHDWVIDWKDTDDYMEWEVDVVTEGEYFYSLVYTCPKEDTGSVFRLSAGESMIQTTLSTAFIPSITPSPDRTPNRPEALEQSWGLQPIWKDQLS